MCIRDRAEPVLDWEAPQSASAEPGAPAVPRQAPETPEAPVSQKFGAQKSGAQKPVEQKPGASRPAKTPPEASPKTSAPQATRAVETESKKPAQAKPAQENVTRKNAAPRKVSEMCIRDRNVLLCESGTVVDLRDGVATVVGEIPCEYLYVDGRSVGEVTESDLKDRRILGEEGFVSIVTAIDRATKRVVTGPDIHARGIAEDDAVFDEIVPKITAALEDALHRAPEKVHTVQQRCV